MCLCRSKCREPKAYCLGTPRCETFTVRRACNERERERDRDKEREKRRRRYVTCEGALLRVTRSVTYATTAGHASQRSEIPRCKSHDRRLD